MNIACVLAEGFEDSELRIPVDALVRAGHDVVIVGEARGEELVGKNGHEKVKADLGIEDAKGQRFDALLIPGGHSPDALRADRRFVDFVSDIDKAGKPIFAVCHGPQLLITAERVKDRKMTAWQTIQGDLQKAGADVVDEQVVIDGNLLTSRNPEDLQAFSEAAINMLASPSASH
ncbi:MAG TPA: type 1 glutamine amidotransferase domain-containing protein [Myxococcota bacterium]